MTGNTANPSSLPSPGVAMLRLLRPLHWSKSLLLLVPMFAGHQVNQPNVSILLVAMAGFCLLSSGSYIFNDLLDRAADRLHGTKHARPLASGAISPALAVIVMLACWAVGLLLAAWVSTGFLLVAVVYLLLAQGYSLDLKKRAMVDVLVLASLYVLRIWAGGEAIDILPSSWLLGFSFFLFISLALMKRMVELSRTTDLPADEALAGRGYLGRDRSLVRQMGLASGYLAVVVLALYINSEAVLLLYAQPMVLWGLVALLWLALSRLWLLADRGVMDDDPVAFVLTDGPSYGLLLLGLAVMYMAQLPAGWCGT